MTEKDIARLRLYNQHVSHQKFKTPAEIVGSLGAVQAQDYAGAKWALGLRLKNARDAAIEKAMTNGDILRTHVLRPTWHFVTPEDIRRMITLTGPRINQLSGTRNRQLKLDARVYKQTNDILAKALEGKQLTRNELAEKLEQAGISTGTERMVHIMATAELDCVVTSGARQGKQFTYALFDDRVPKAKPFDKEEAIIDLADRYFNSRGPATLHDFVWWSGLTVADAKSGLEEIKKKLVNAVINDITYWMPAHLPDAKLPPASAYLLPAFDEFNIAYKDRSAAINIKHAEQAGYLIFDPTVVVNGRIMGNWKRAVGKKIDISLKTFDVLKPAQIKAIEKAAARFGKFWGMDVVVAV